MTNSIYRSTQTSIEHSLAVFATISHHDDDDDDDDDDYYYYYYYRYHYHYCYCYYCDYYFFAVFFRVTHQEGLLVVGLPRFNDLGRTFGEPS